MNETELRPAIIGPFGPAQLACLRSWNSLGLAPVFIHIQEPWWSVRPALKLAGYRRFTTEELATSEGVAALLAFLERERVGGVTCLSDEMAIWLNELRPRMPSMTKVWLPESRVIRFLSSKSAQIGLAQRVGLATLRTFEIRRSVDELPDDVRFPMVARPDGPGAVAPSFKAAFIASRDHLREFTARFDRISRPIVLQQYIEGPNLVIHGYRGAGGLPVGHIAFLAERKFEGLSLTVRPLALDSEVRRKCEAFCNKIDIVGCYHFDFILDIYSDICYFLEMNGRLGGTTAKVFACGYDEPASLLAAHGALPDKAFGGSLDSGRPCCNRLSLAKYLFHLASGRITPLDYRPASVWKGLRDIACGAIWWRDEIFSCNEFRSSLSYYAQWLFGRFSAPPRR